MVFARLLCGRWPGLLLLAVMASGLFASPAQAWWNSDWPNRMKIVADAGAKGANVTEPVGRTQVLIRLHSGNFNFDTAKDDGADLRVIAGDDRTPLRYHLEKYDGLVDQVALIWVDVPDLAPGTATSLYLYWGNQAATSGSDAKATYDPDQLLVYHFNDENGLPRDATGYANNAQTAGRRDEGGMIGFGLRLDGKSPIRIPASPSMTIPAGQAMTWSMWVRAGAISDSGALYAIRDNGNALTIGLDKGVAYAEITGAAGTARTLAGAALTGEAWHHIAVTVSDRLTVYVDGEARGEVAANMPGMSAASVLGGPMPAPAASADPAPAGTPAAAPTVAGASTPVPQAVAEPVAFAGLLDEFQIAKLVRPTGVFQIAVRSQGPQANLLTFETAEQRSVLGNGYLAIILRSVTPDAWVVIGILGVMSLISWIVMIGKALYISRVSGANKKFHREFRGLMSRAVANGGRFEPLDVAKKPALRKAPLYRLYEVGSREQLERLDAGRVGGDGRLAPQSLAAIRSSLDAGLSVETMRLNRLMVLLTIAISGGPFLGLLGTVVGVMITFAAIAAAGDVNVNSIAPGISAALLATVAGLAVAIPSLFGYNYFLTRIRDVTNEMHVFVDELVTRMGEGVHSPLPEFVTANAPAPTHPVQRAAE